ncbi:hypothetical protein BT67DRAFT_453438 [Trichocladium antarcticum]|uniref:Uncharacterized protein n=1 Tax=Trichocladium antarcticum TaxID=1450529 RepID=A0AAN6ZIL9_9PEZI|nr:hypothetical protein BT67DRAFT_453438 [Trichocladium antarcticum]
MVLTSGSKEDLNYVLNRLFKRLVSILTEGDNTLLAGPAANEQQENSAAAAAAAAAAATAAAALAALPDLEPNPIYKTNIGMPPPPPRVTGGNNTSPAGLAATEQQEGSPTAAAAACKTIAKRRAPSATSKRKKKKKEDADELSLQGHTTKYKIPPESLYNKVRDWYEAIREVKDSSIYKETATAPAANPFFASPRAATYSTSLFLTGATP